MKGFLRVVDGLSSAFGECCLYMTLLLLVLVFGGVTSRYVFNAPIKWIPEVSQFLFGGSFMLAGAATLLWGGHVRVDIFVNRLSPKAQVILELVNSIFLYLFCGMLLYQGAIMVWDSVSVRETAATFWGPPVWPIKMIIPISALMLLTQGLAKTIRDCYHIVAITREKPKE